MKKVCSLFLALSLAAALLVGCGSSSSTASPSQTGGSGSDGDVEERLLLGEHSACESGESVGDRKADDLHPAFVFCQRCNESIIVTGCPEKIAGSRI